MDYNTMTIDELKNDLIIDGKKGYPFFIAGTLYWLVMGYLNLFIDSHQQLALFYIVGTGIIFPLAIVFSKILKVNILSKNPLGVIGGIIGGIQAFYIPVWVIIYIEQFELIPMVIGILGASHFLPYLWIYKSKAYAIFTITMALSSFVFGYVIIGQAFSLLPFLLAAIYLLMTIALIIESRSFITVQNNSGISK
ncbi:MAG: hypothetical protein K6T88_14690 [Bacillus sp. (in: Bacteria)]|nr:hypothetical protein [Bacillus sp. (in: firmicutes)]